jgi:hypothetical protein
MDLGFDKCILCLGEGPLTEEHLVPACIGGSFQIKALCAKCNNGRGSELVAGIYNDPSIRLAVDQVRSVVPGFVQEIGAERFYFSKTPDEQLLRLSAKGKSERVLPAHRNGEIVIQDVREMPRTLEGRMTKAGLSRERIEAVLKDFHRAGNNEPVVVPEIDLVAIKRPMPTDLKVDLDHRAKSLDHGLVALMAFEFLASIIGTEVYADEFEPIRNYILLGTPTDRVSIEPFLVRKTEPLHYLHLEPLPGGIVQVDIGFFRSSVYRVKLSGLRPLDAHMVYEEDLEAGTARFGFKSQAEAEWKQGWLIPPKEIGG